VFESAPSPRTVGRLRHDGLRVGPLAGQAPSLAEIQSGSAAAKTQSFWPLRLMLFTISHCCL